LIDAYCGIGSIGIYLADKLRHLIGIDEIPEAVENARENAALNKLSSFEFHCDRVERFLVSSKLENDNCTVILDPPRGGVDAEAINSLTARKIHKVIYISCNPMTLARDVKLFLQKGYSLMEIAPFDMFPQTWHIETLAVLQYTGNKTV
ncbi:MAG: methyltransferase domain-containing protein, partial [Candidatus Cloacimonetes bacterium]|nr:methyltransferase domain-containing protein [Candidatus Cloacimonadota bacterium]